MCVRVCVRVCHALDGLDAHSKELAQTTKHHVGVEVSQRKARAHIQTQPLIADEAWVRAEGQ
eukprot:104851-Pelagomonas_calceolata.AAC.6